MKTLILLVFVLTSTLLVNAENKNNRPDCDVCSTSSSTTALNFNLNSKNNIGLNYLYQNYNSKNGIFKNSKYFKEHYRTLFLSGNYNMTKKWNVTLGIPFQMHSRALKDRSIDQFESSLGDINLQTFYSVFQSDSLDNSPITIRIGGGFKIPIAEYKPDNGLSQNPNFNLGSGSWDFNLSSQINWAFGTSDLNTQINYTWKTENSESFKFGNQLDLSVLYYNNINWIKSQSFTLLSGIRSEWYAKNEQTGYKVDKSEGNAQFAQVGFDFPIKAFNIGGMAYLPLHQKLMDDRLKVNSRGLVYVKWAF